MSVETGAEGSTTPKVVACTRRKLLVLDVNGFLLDTYRRGEPCPGRPHDGTVNRFFVYNRPFCSDFLRFCLDNFVVGVWSSVQQHNVQAFVEYIFKETKQKLAFVWHQGHCTNTGFMHPDNLRKPVFLKELWKLWTKTESDLPWQAGDYGPSNTLLIDDSPHKAIKNPPHTAIFPKTYSATDQRDTYLGKELRIYLEGLLQMTNVQIYLEENPIGEPNIAMGDPRWSTIFMSLKAENRPGRLVVTHAVRTDQSPGHDVPPARLVEAGSQRTVNNKEPEEEEGLEQNLRGEDGSDLQSMLRKLCLEEVPA